MAFKLTIKDAEVDWSSHPPQYSDLVITFGNDELATALSEFLQWIEGWDHKVTLTHKPDNK